MSEAPRDVPAPPGRRLRVAWLCEYNLARLAHRLPPASGRHFHPAPWLTNGARALAASGRVQLHVVSYSKLLERDYEFDEEGIRFHILRAPLPAVPRAAVFYRLDLPRFERAIDRIAPDVVHGHGTENVYSLAAVRARVPHVISLQAVIENLAGVQRTFSRSAVQFRFVRRTERQAIGRAREVLAKAPFVEDLVHQVNPAARVTVVDNIVSEEFFNVSREPSGERLMFVGSLLAAKGVEDAIAAFHRVAESRPHVELHIVGSGSAEYVDRLKAKAASGAGAGRITFRGFLSPADIAAEYRRVTLLVAPSYSDTSPNVVSEAQVAGVPVVAARVGGLSYMLDEGRAGRLVPAGDVAALADALGSLLQSPEECAAMAVRARLLARQRHSPETFASKLIAVYDRVVAAASHDRADALRLQQ